MAYDSTFLAFGLVVLSAYAVQTMIGFGSMVLCVTFGALLLPLPEVLSLAVPVSLVQTGYILVRHFRAIRARVLFLEVLPLMLLGAGLSVWLLGDLRASWLKRAFGVLVLVLAVREIWARLRPAADGLVVQVSKPAQTVALFGAGVVHGLFATGGPLLVYAIGRRGLSKGEFRSTVTTVWFVLNFALVVVYAQSGRIGSATILPVLSLVPAVGIGIAVGEVLHARIDEERFRRVLFVVLAVAALTLVVRG
ncbi:MAG TPA: sulfite exporter TauE/SafE family protein [Polyangiaceae bacterium]|nr:sulfite exporter TauE/SafE family protein [Polyangiaceae bacterium]HMR75911.1 sulfite exporter TauE/SafE family protein [Polyangiaceae bacterium]